MIPTGYGSQTKLLLKKFEQMGHEVAVSCATGAPMATLSWQGIKLFPDSGHSAKYGMDMVKTHAERWGADVVISWLDAFSIPCTVAKALNWGAWVPVDSEPMMVRNVDPLKACKWTMAPTKWGVQMLHDAGLPNAMLLPCAYDPQLFKNLGNPHQSKVDFAKLIKRPDVQDKFLVNVVSANSGGRKNYQAIFAAWRFFHADHPNTLLYLHTDITGYFCGGSDLVEMAKLYGCADDSIFYVSQWEYSTGQLGEEYLNLVYNASDVHLNCCYGEGFGLPIMEAQAAGCPTIVPDFAAATEVGQCYKITKGEMYSTVPGALQFMVDVGDVVRMLNAAYENRHMENRQAISDKTKPWQVDEVCQKYWHWILDGMQEDTTCSQAC